MQLHFILYSIALIILNISYFNQNSLNCGKIDVFNYLWQAPDLLPVTCYNFGDLYISNYYLVV